MSKVIVYELEAGLPLYLINDTTTRVRDETDVVIGSFDTDLGKRQDDLEKASIHEDLGDEDDNIPEWVKLAAQLGRLGEMLALDYLSEQSFDNVEHVGRDARLGYDIRAIKDGVSHAYEIKTTTKNNNKFHISQHELLVGNTMQDLYHIMFIKLDLDTKIITGYVIDNPIKALDIDFIGITKLIKTKTVELTASQFIINLNENFLLGFEEIPLNAYIEKWLPE